MIHLVWPITLISDSDTNILIIEEILCITSSSSSIFDQDQSYLFRHIIYQIMLMNIGCSLSYLRKCWTEKFTSITNLVHICFKKYIPHYMHSKNIHSPYHEGISDVSKCCQCRRMALFLWCVFEWMMEIENVNEKQRLHSFWPLV